MNPGRHIAEQLDGSWRQPTIQRQDEARAPGLSGDLERLLLETGCAALAWWRASRDSHVTTRQHETPARASQLATRMAKAAGLYGQGARSHPFHRVFLSQAHEAVLHEEHVRLVLRHCRAAGLEPVLVKGWSVTRLYAHPGLRPAGDIDLCVAPGEFQRATLALADRVGWESRLDLHEGVADLEDRRWADVFRRTRLIPLGDTSVRVLGPEDQLRHLCLHLMRHGGWRPLWLCDVAATAEAAWPDFDWDLCLSGEGWRTGWVLAALGLAHRLLGAELPGEVARRAADLPPWLPATVLQLWSGGAASRDGDFPPFARSLRNWQAVGEAVRRRWPNPILAAYRLRLSPWTRRPLRVLQGTAFLRRGRTFAGKLLARVPGELAGRSFHVHRRGAA
jgi:hypothetical protein